MARSEPGAIRAALPKAAPEAPEPFEAILRDMDALIAPGLSHFQHPRFFGYFPANSDLSSVLGDFLSSGLGALGLTWQAAPALTEVEEAVADWMRQLVGLSAAWSGVIQDTASTSTLVALICARERTTNYSLARGGLAESGKRLVVYTSAQSNSSVEKDVLLAGFGRENLRFVDLDAAYAMRADALEAMVQADLAAGRTPCAIVATTGATGTTALDPIAALAGDREALWDLASCRRGDGRFGDDPAGMPLDVGGDRERRLARLQSAQMAWRRFRLFALLCSRSPASHPRDGRQPELSAQPRRRRGDELSRLGRPAWPPLPGAETLVSFARRRRGGFAGAPSPRHGKRPLARRRGCTARRAGGFWRLFRCRRSASATSPRDSKARRSTATRSPGRRRLTALEKPMLRPRFWTVVGWCAFRWAR